MKIAFTGHRPQHTSTINADFVEIFLNRYLPLLPPEPHHFITGGALGVDQWAANYARGMGIPYELVLPFPIHVMADRWSDHDHKNLLLLAEHATNITTITGLYDIRAYQRRNEAMVDASDFVIAFWNPAKRSGGTYNCIRYANHAGKSVINAYTGVGRLTTID